MLFRQSDLALDPIQEANAILNEAEYLAESESVTSAVAIPVVENARIGACVVKFDDLSRLAEDHGMTFDEAMVTVAEANGVDPYHLAVAVRETTVMAYPGIVNELCNVVVTPLPETDTMYQFTEACVDAFVESGDEIYMDLLLDEAAKKGGNSKTNSKTNNTTNNTTNDLDPEQMVKDALPDVSKKKKPGYYSNGDGTGYSFDNNGNVTHYTSLGGRINAAHARAKLDREIAKGEMQNAKGVKKLLKAIKYYGWNTPKERILAAINALQKKYQEIINNIPANEKKQTFWQSILKTIDKYISKLTHLFKKKAMPDANDIIGKDKYNQKELNQLKKGREKLNTAGVSNAADYAWNRADGKLQTFLK